MRTSGFLGTQWALKKRGETQKTQGFRRYVDSGITKNVVVKKNRVILRTVNTYDLFIAAEIASFHRNQGRCSQSGDACTVLSTYLFPMCGRRKYDRALCDADKQKETHFKFRSNGSNRCIEYVSINLVL